MTDKSVDGWIYKPFEENPTGREGQTVVTMAMLLNLKQFVGDSNSNSNERPCVAQNLARLISAGNLPEERPLNLAYLIMMRGKQR